MADWPGADKVPQEFLHDGYQERSRPASLTETPMDAGDPKRRSRSTQIIRELPLRMVCTSAQLDKFEAFAYKTLKQLTLRFNNFPHPRKGLIGNVRLVSIDDISAMSTTHYAVGFTIEWRESAEDLVE